MGARDMRLRVYIMGERVDGIMGGRVWNKLKTKLRRRGEG